MTVFTFFSASFRDKKWRERERERERERDGLMFFLKEQSQSLRFKLLRVSNLEEGLKTIRVNVNPKDTLRLEKFKLRSNLNGITTLKQ